MKKHTIRIVGGSYKRSLIPVPNIPGLRPTPDRVRETLFNWLNHLWQGDFSGKHVLDVFAGSGALGFEAASRGAAHVQMIESDQKAVQALKALRERLGATSVRIHMGNAIQTLKRTPDKKFDLILLDPPFDQNLLEQVWQPLHTILAPNTLVYVESDTPAVLPSWLATVRSSKAGQVYFYLCQFAATQNKVDNSTYLNSD